MSFCLDSSPLSLEGFLEPSNLSVGQIHVIEVQGEALASVKCKKILCRPGLCRGPELRWGSSQRFPRPPAWLLWEAPNPVLGLLGLATDPQFLVDSSDTVNITRKRLKQELSYRKQTARQLCT